MLEKFINLQQSLLHNRVSCLIIHEYKAHYLVGIDIKQQKIDPKRVDFFVVSLVEHTIHSDSKDSPTVRRIFLFEELSYHWKINMIDSNGVSYGTILFCRTGTGNLRAGVRP